MRMLRGSRLMPASGEPALAEAPVDSPFKKGFEPERDKGEESEEGCESEGCCDVVLIVEDLDLQRDGVGKSANVSRYDRDSAEFAHRAGVAEQDAGEQGPADI